MMISSTDDVSRISSSPTNNHSSGGGGRRKPLQLLTGIFSRKSSSRRDVSSVVSDSMDKSPYVNEDGDNDMWNVSDESPTTILEPREALHSPYHARTIDQDMENLRLSRQDNPYLQVLASRECLNESDDCSEYEEKHLMAKENLSGSRDPLTLAEVHARLVRSPPPIMWTRGRNSEPSFSRITSHHSMDGDSDCVFQFPPVNSSNNTHHHHHPPHHHSQQRVMSPTHSCRSGPASYKFLGPFDFNSRMRDSTIEAVSGKFNLSPQPRRRPDKSTMSELTT